MDSRIRKGGQYEVSLAGLRGQLQASKGGSPGFWKRCPADPCWPGMDGRWVEVPCTSILRVGWALWSPDRRCAVGYADRCSSPICQKGSLQAPTIVLCEIDKWMVGSPSLVSGRSNDEHSIEQALRLRECSGGLGTFRTERQQNEGGPNGTRFLGDVRGRPGIPCHPCGLVSWGLTRVG